MEVCYFPFRCLAFVKLKGDVHYQNTNIFCLIDMISFFISIAPEAAWHLKQKYLSKRKGNAILKTLNTSQNYMDCFRCGLGAKEMHSRP